MIEAVYLAGLWLGFAGLGHRLKGNHIIADRLTQLLLKLIHTEIRPHLKAIAFFPVNFIFIA